MSEGRPRILLLIPTRTYRAEDFVRAATALDVDVTVGSEEASSLEHLNPADLLTLDFSRPGDATATAIAFAERHPLRAVVAVDDQATLAAAAVAEALGLTQNPVAALRAAKDKALTRRLLAKAGVPQPAWRVASLAADPAELAAATEYPCVLKPLTLSASRGVLRADGPAELQAAFETIRSLVDGAGELLVEAFVPGWEVAVEGLLRDGELTVLALFDKPDPLDGPTFPETIYVTPSRLPREVQQRIGQLTADAVRALGLTDGPIHAELRGHDDALWFLEVAARSIGGLCSRALRFGIGVSLEELILRHALGLPLESTEREASAAGVLMLHTVKAGTFREVRGLEAARALPRVEEVTISVHAGQRVAPLPAADPLYLGFAFARAETPAEVEAALRSVEATLEVVVDETREEDP